MGTSIYEQVDIEQGNTWYNKTRAGDRWNRIQVERQDLSRYNIVMIIN